jgi:hypothetical protein
MPKEQQQQNIAKSYRPSTRMILQCFSTGPELSLFCRSFGGLQDRIERGGDDAGPVVLLGMQLVSSAAVSSGAET